MSYLHLTFFQPSSNILLPPWFFVPISAFLLAMPSPELPRSLLSEGSFPVADSSSFASGIPGSSLSSSRPVSSSSAENASTSPAPLSSNGLSTAPNDALASSLSHIHPDDWLLQFTKGDGHYAA